MQREISLNPRFAPSSEMSDELSLCARVDSNDQPSDPKSETSPGQARDSVPVHAHSGQERTGGVVLNPTKKHIIKPLELGGAWTWGGKR